MLRPKRRWAEFVKQLSAGEQAQLLNLASKLGSQGLGKYADEIVARLLATASDAKLGDSERLAAARQLISVRADDEVLVGQLLAIVNPRASSTLAGGLIDALVRANRRGLGRRWSTACRIDAGCPCGRGARAVEPARLDAGALLGAIEHGQLQLTDLSLDQKQSLAAYPDKALARRARNCSSAGERCPMPIGKKFSLN